MPTLITVDDCVIVMHLPGSEAVRAPVCAFGSRKPWVVRCDNGAISAANVKKGIFSAIPCERCNKDFVELSRQPPEQSFRISF